MRYVRTFHIQAAHFNSDVTYSNYEKAMKDNDISLLHQVLFDCHGHNFKIEVDAEADRMDKDGFVVDDVLISEVIRKFDNINLSISSEFHGLRATTENFVNILYKKLTALFPKVTFCITIYETDFIKASI